MGKSGGGNSPLDSDRGVTTVEEPVVTSIVSAIVQEVEKVQPSTGGTRVPGDSSPTVGEFLGGLGGANRARGVSIQMDDREASVDLTLNVPYGESIPEVTQAVRDAVVDRVKNQAGIEVTDVNITVGDISLPE
ncbi:MAG: Asp23/Gls24 family envelope stress response protein [Rubrobacteraceae bacterium]